jgi:hypothetical protein
MRPIQEFDIDEQIVKIHTGGRAARFSLCSSFLCGLMKQRRIYDRLPDSPQRDLQAE